MSDIERAKDGDFGRGGGGNGGGVGGNGGDDEDEEGGGVPLEKDNLKLEHSKRCRLKGKRAYLFRFRKGKKLLQQRTEEKTVNVNSGSSGRMERASACFLCLKQPQTRDSSGESPTSDPNSSDFTFDKLRSLIEKSDFYSKECNPH